MGLVTSARLDVPQAVPVRLTQIMARAWAMDQWRGLLRQESVDVPFASFPCQAVAPVIDTGQGRSVSFPKEGGGDCLSLPSAAANRYADTQP
jgi:hypothetical protein